MHRDAHFGGKFEFMLDYYDKDGKGVNADFDVERIKELAETEKRLGQNLSVLMLSGAEVEKVAAARLAYKGLRELYETKNPRNRLPLLIADLILSEEEEPEQEISALVAERSAAVPFLIDLLRSPDFTDALFPGYGQAPSLAVRCLGQIGDKRALASLFEAIGEGDFFDEDLILDALKSIGEPAKHFLLTILQSRPLNYDNERAAIALERFMDDPEVCKICLNMLWQPEVRRNIPLATYLTIICEGLEGQEEREHFQLLLEDPATPSSLKASLKSVAKAWKERQG
jgi:hypothetical protein